MYSFSSLYQQFNEYVKTYPFPQTPKQLYAPVEYILSLEGKRARPLLTLAAYNLFNEDIDFAMDAAMAIEVFHNFSLLHDDIMDNADIRRGKESVHVKYDSNSAILSGDVMMIWSYKLLEKYIGNSPDVLPLFTNTAIEVCEGQRYDMNFEERSDVTIEQYIEMITLKTSVLLGSALQMGGMIAQCSMQDAFHLYEFGKNVGIAFQIQDDILDTFGDQVKFGKRIGGDIIQKKKTYLYLKSLELLSDDQVRELRHLFANENLIEDEVHHIASVKALFKIAHVNVHAEELKLVYQQLAFSHLNALSIEKEKLEILKGYADKLLNRIS